MDPFRKPEIPELTEEDHDKLTRLNKDMINKEPFYYLETYVIDNKIYTKLINIRDLTEHTFTEDLEANIYQNAHVVKFIYVESDLLNEPLSVQYNQIRDTFLKYLYNDQHRLPHSPVYNIHIHSPFDIQLNKHDPSKDMFALAVYNI